MEFQDYLAILLRRKWIVVYAFLAVTLAAVVAAYSRPQVYQAKSLVMVEQKGVEIMLQTHPHILPKWISLEARERIMRSKPFLEKVAATVNLPASVIQDTVSTKVDPPSGIIEITVQYSDRIKTLKIAQGVATEFIQYSKEIASRELVEARKFLEQRAINMKEDLEAADSKLQRYKMREGIYNLDDEMKELASTSLRLGSTIHDLSDQIARNEILMEKSQQVKLHPVPNPEAAEVRRDLELLKGQLKQARVKYTEKHPDVISLKDQISRLQETIKSKSDVIWVSGPEEAQRQRELGTENTILFEKIRALKQLQLTTQRRLSFLMKKNLEYMEMKRKVDSLEESYNFLMRSLDDTKMRESMVIGDVRVVELSPAAYPTRKVDKKRLAYVGILGLLLGIATTLFLEYADTRIKTSDDIKRYVGLPVLGLLPYVNSQASPVLLNAPIKSSLSEAYQALCFNAAQICLERSVKSFMIVSCKQGEGKTTIASSMAVSMARSGEKVILLDADLRRPRIHQIFGVDNSNGLSNLLKGEVQAERAIRELSQQGRSAYGDPQEKPQLESHLTDEDLNRVLKATAVEGLKVIPSGPIPPNPIDLLKSNNLKLLMEKLKERANVIIFDTPPAHFVVDALVLGTIIDGILVVVESGTINRNEGTELKEVFASSKASLLGAVLNSTSSSSDKYYYYSYYYRRGSGGKRRKRS